MRLGISSTDLDHADDRETVAVKEEQRSIALTKNLIKETIDRPSIVLMSSKDVGDKAKDYRTALDGQVLNLRFGFMKKEEISLTGDPGDQDVQATDHSADILLDTIQGLHFRSRGRARPENLA